MKNFFCLLVLGILLIGSAYSQPDLSDRTQPLAIEYDVGYEHITDCLLSYICDPCVAQNIDPLVGGNESLGICSYGLARSCGWTVYTFLTLSNPYYPCYEPDEYYGLCRTQTTNASFIFYHDSYGLANSKPWPSELV